MIQEINDYQIYNFIFLLNYFISLSVILSQFPKANASNVLHFKNNFILTLGRISLGLYHCPCGFVIRPRNVTSFPPVTSTLPSASLLFSSHFSSLVSFCAFMPATEQDVTLNFVRARSLSTILMAQPRRHQPREAKEVRVHVVARLDKFLIKARRAKYDRSCLVTRLSIGYTVSNLTISRWDTRGSQRKLFPNLFSNLLFLTFFFFFLFFICQSFIVSFISSILRLSLRFEWKE